MACILADALLQHTVLKSGRLNKVSCTAAVSDLLCAVYRRRDTLVLHPCQRRPPLHHAGVDRLPSRANRCVCGWPAGQCVCRLEGVPPRLWLLSCTALSLGNTPTPLSRAPLMWSPPSAPSASGIAHRLLPRSHPFNPLPSPPLTSCPLNPSRIPPHTPAASKALVHDLDLTVRAAGLNGIPLLGNGGSVSDPTTPDRCALCHAYTLCHTYQLYAITA